MGRYEVRGRVRTAAGERRARLDSRGGRDLTATFPEIVDALEEALAGAAWSVGLDGELVATGADGAPDFTLLQRRLGARPTESLLAVVPGRYVLFDLAWHDQLDGPTFHLPYLRRRELLPAAWSLSCASVDPRMGGQALVGVGC